MNMIVETDLGHDPDDFFTICYLAAAGVNIRAIVVTPGDRDQLAIAHMLSKEICSNCPVGFSKVSTKSSSGNFHWRLLDKYGYSREASGDGLGAEIITKVMRLYPTADWFIGGPPSNFGRYLEAGGAPPAHCTMQGGFLSYDSHPYAKHRLPQFEGKTWCPTFNMNGDRKGTLALTSAGIKELRFAGKNVCHSVMFDRARFDEFPAPKNVAGELFHAAARVLFRDGVSKKFHDPVAACCHLHPEVGQWVRGVPRKMQGGWTTELDENGAYVLGELDREVFWQYMKNLS